MCVQKEGSKETAEGRTKDKLWCVRRKHFRKNQLIQELKIQTVPSPCGCWRGWGIYWCWGRFHGDSVHNSMAGALNWFLFHSLMHTQKSWCRPLLLLWGTMEKRAVGLCQAPESCNLCCTWSFCRPQRVFFFSSHICVSLCCLAQLRIPDIHGSVSKVLFCFIWKMILCKNKWQCTVFASYQPLLTWGCNNGTFMMQIATWKVHRKSIARYFNILFKIKIISESL